MNFSQNSGFTADPDVHAAMKEVGLDPFAKKAPPKDVDLPRRQLRSWANEIQDVIFELEENEPVDDQIVRLRELQSRIEVVLESLADEASTASTTDSPDRPTG